VRDRGVQVDAVPPAQQEQLVAVFEPDLPFEDEQEPLSAEALRAVLRACAGDVDDHGVHRAAAPLVGPMLDRHAPAPSVGRIEPALAILDGDVPGRHRESGDEFIDAALEHGRQLHEAVERWSELPVLEFGEPAHREVGPRDDLFQREFAGEAGVARPATEVRKIHRRWHGCATQGGGQRVCAARHPPARGMDAFGRTIPVRQALGRRKCR